jgi:Acetyltransferases
MNEIVIRSAQTEDVDILTEIQIESWKKAFASILSKETLQKFTDFDLCKKILNSVLDSQKGRLSIAFLNGEACGELFWCDAEQDMPGYAEIVALHSLQKSWGKGVGKALMDNTLAEISASGKSHTFLWVFKENNRARKFYEKSGFHTDGSERVSDFDNAIEIMYVR